MTEEGIEMIQSEHSAKSFARRSFAMARSRLDARGSDVLRRLLSVAGMVWVVSGLFALSGTPALAKQVRLLTGTFGASTSSPANPYPLNGPEHVAVDDSTHDVYVTEPSNARVEKFTAKGELILMFGKEVNRTKVKEVGSTEAEQNLCTVASSDECGVGKETPSSPIGQPDFVAVDNSSGESKGDIYVSNGHSASGLIDKFDSSGNLISSWATGGQLDGSTVKKPSAPVEGPFGEIVGMDVDTSGNLWAQTVNNNTFEFRADAGFVTGWREGGDEFSLDSTDDLYSTTGTFPYVLEHDAAGNLIGDVVSKEPEGPQSIVVDPSTNNIYVGLLSKDGQFLNINRFDSSCHPSIVDERLGPPCSPVEIFGAGQLRQGNHGLAIDPSTPADVLYATETQVGPALAQIETFASETVPDVSVATPSGLTSTSATLEGSVDPAGVPLTECFFEWGETSAYGNKAQCESPGAGEIPADSNSHTVHAAITGLQAGKTYHYRLVAANANDVNALIDEPSLSADFAFGPPSIEDESVLGDTATSVRLQAQINPNNIDTSFHIEYGTQTGSYGQLTPETDIGSDGTGQDVQVDVQGLLAGTVYYYRVVATNSLGTTESQEQAFTTQTSGAFSLPDGRAWELVSPPDKRGALIEDIGYRGLVQASAEGGAVTYLASAPTELQPAGNSNFTQVLSVRTDDGWASRDISTPRDEANGLVFSGVEEDRFFSPDLSSAVVEPFGVFVPSLSSEASEKTPYLRSNYASGNSEDPCVSSCYRPLVTGAAGFANVPEGTEFGESSRCRKEGLCGPEFVGASPNGSHIVLTAGAALVEGAPANSLYEWGDGQLQLVSILPEEIPAPARTADLGSGGIHEITRARHGNIASAISADGSRIAWSTGVGSNKRLYLRDMPLEETIELGGQGAIFQTANADGSRVFFTEKNELYVFEATLTGALSTGHTNDLTPGGELLAEIAVSASRDGSSVYFVAKGALTGTPDPGGEVAQPGQPNLYVSRAGTVELVAVLSTDDLPDWGLGAALMGTMRVSPDGAWLAFMSDRPLTGYDNRDVNSGVSDEEVFLYHAGDGSGGGKLVCASCDPTGARPHGFSEGGGEFPVTDEQGAWEGSWLAANIPAWISSLYQPRYLSDGGRLFFNSDDALVPSDTNGTEDVYEYEPSGIGDCTSTNAMFSARSGGCVDLISSGTSSEESGFLDASESGDDVFFVTGAQLSPTDRDTSLDVYDARVAGGFAEPQAPPACEGDACQSPVAAPNDPTPGSLTYQGPANPGPLLTVSKSTTKKAVKCTKGKKLSHGKCAKSKKKKAKKAKRAANTGRAGKKRGVRS